MLTHLNELLQLNAGSMADINSYMLLQAGGGIENTL